MLLKLYRISHALCNAGIPFLPKLIKGSIYLFFNAVIPPECIVGYGTKLWHSGLGIIIHPNVTIGTNCNIYNHVVIGGGHDSPDGPSTRITIGNNVNISAGAKILSAESELSIGDNSTIAANAVVLHNVPSGVIVGGIPAQIIKKKNNRNT